MMSFKRDRLIRYFPPVSSRFGSWPEGHIVVGADAKLLLRTEAVNGEGALRPPTRTSHYASL
jgi:hypothetical protein